MFKIEILAVEMPDRYISPKIGGTDVILLHSELGQFGCVLPDAEFQRSRVSKATRTAALAFQQGL